MKTMPARARLIRISASALSIAAVALLSSCSTTGQNSEESSTHRIIERSDVHAVHSKRLKDVMAELFVLSIDSAPSGVAAAEADPANLKEVKSAARDMAAAAAGIPDILLDVKLPVERKMAFLDAVETLRSESLTLDREAPNMTRIQMRDQLRRIESACTACHSKFRFLPAIPDDLYFQ